MTELDIIGDFMTRIGEPAGLLAIMATFAYMLLRQMVRNANAKNVQQQTLLALQDRQLDILQANSTELSHVRETHDEQMNSLRDLLAKYHDSIEKFHSHQTRKDGDMQTALDKLAETNKSIVSLLEVMHQDTNVTQKKFSDTSLRTIETVEKLRIELERAKESVLGDLTAIRETVIYNQQNTQKLIDLMGKTQDLHVEMIEANKRLINLFEGKDKAA